MQWLHKLVDLYEEQLYNVMGGECALATALLFLSAKSNEHCKSLDEIVICFLVLCRPTDSAQSGTVSRDVSNQPPNCFYVTGYLLTYFTAFIPGFEDFKGNSNTKRTVGVTWISI